MKRFLALILAGVFAIATLGPVFADQTGYEGQPGNQSNGGGGNGNGLNGYEGQPGHQGGH